MNQIAADRVKRLIGLYGDTYHRIASERLRDRMSACDTLLIFGAGQNGRLLLRLLRQAGLEPAAFVDETPGKAGQTVEGAPVISPEAAGARPDALIIVSLFTPGHDYLRVAGRLRALGLETAPLFAALWALGGEALPFYFLAPPQVLLDAEAEIAWLAERMLDRTSLDALCAHLEFRLALRYEGLPLWSARRLSAPAEWRRFGLVDAGAFDGDTLLPMLADEAERIEFALALEPDAVNFSALSTQLRTAYPERVEFRALPVAVDETSGRRGFASLGHTGSGFAEEGPQVETVALDDLLADAPDDMRLYLKLDVEGAEAAALRGARRIIAERAPFMSIAAYHQPSDLWALPRAVFALDEGYRFRLRSHGADGADLMIYAEPSR